MWPWKIIIFTETPKSNFFPFFEWKLLKFVKARKNSIFMNFHVRPLGGWFVCWSVFYNFL